eukprot:scaffold26487_cov66-Phaeocystis_antarctica.AAC.2
MREWVSGNEPRRGAAAAIMANIKEGLGTESPPTCTNGLVAARRAEPRVPKAALSYARAPLNHKTTRHRARCTKRERAPLVDVHHSTRRTDACHDASRTIRVHRPLSPSAGPDACLSRSSYRLQSPSAGGVAIPPAA